MNARANFTEDEDTAADRAARKEHYASKAESVLKMEVCAALLSGDTQTKRITVPLVGVKWSAATMLSDQLARATGDATLAAMLGFVSRLATQGDKEALAWIDARAEEHADFHANCLADEWAAEDLARAEEHAAQEQWESRQALAWG